MDQWGQPLLNSEGGSAQPASAVHAANAAAAGRPSSRCVLHSYVQDMEAMCLEPRDHPSAEWIDQNIRDTGMVDGDNSVPVEESDSDCPEADPRSASGGR